MKPGLIAVLLLAGAPAAAQTVHKCVDAAGAVTYQSFECAVGETAGKSWRVEPVTTTAAELKTRKARERANSAYLRKLAQRHRRATGGGVAISGHRDAHKCEAAKARRAKAEAGAKRLTLAELQRMWMRTEMRQVSELGSA